MIRNLLTLARDLIPRRATPCVHCDDKIPAEFMALHVYAQHAWEGEA